MEPWEVEWFDYYEELGVSPRASTSVIEAAYRTLASNPQHASGPSHSQRIRRIAVAFSVLSDPTKRQVYDVALQSRQSHVYGVRQESSEPSPGSTSDSNLGPSQFAYDRYSSYPPGNLFTDSFDIQSPPRKFASPLRRFVAYNIDIFGLFVPFFFCLILAFSATEDNPEASDAVGSLLFFGYFVALCGYFILMEAYVGATLGKKVLGIKVVRLDGSPIGMGASLVRNTLRIVDLFFYGIVGAIAILSSDHNQRIGDMVGKTIVVHD